MPLVPFAPDRTAGFASGRETCPGPSRRPPASPVRRLLAVPLPVPRRPLVALGLLVAFAAPAGVDAQVGGAPGAPQPERARVVFGTDTVHAEVARTSEERARGLSGRDSLPEHRGMLFVYEDEAVRSFWMRDTRIPLDIAFLDASGRVVDIQSMEPMSRRFHDSGAPAAYALEVERGWFRRHGVRVGCVAEIVFADP